MSNKIFNGILLINKDKDCTSHQIVDEIRQILKQRAIGHAGTLDPMARGLLVILCGIATKLNPYFAVHNKRYTINIKFGLETNTLDIQGKVLKSKQASLKKEDIENLLKKETRDLELPVPLFSATKVQGKKLYSYAFAGKEVQTPIKKMSFWDLEIHEIHKDSVCLSVSCSKGAYIRSFVHYLGQQIKTGACLEKITRIYSGDFNLKNSITIQQLKNKLSKNFPNDEKELKTILEKSFLYPTTALKQFPKMELTKRNAKIIQHGRIPLYIREAHQQNQIDTNKNGQAQIFKAVKGEQLVALLEMRPFEKIRILKNFPQQNF